MQEDQALWLQITSGDALAFEKLYQTHFAPVRHFLHHYLADSAIADEVAQDTFLQFWQRPNGFISTQSNLRAYLFGIARKKAADWWRRHGTADSSAPNVASTSSESALLIGDALKHLDPDLRHLLWLREVEGYSYDELATILDIPLGTVKSRLFSAREQLRRIWNSCE